MVDSRGRDNCKKERGPEPSQSTSSLCKPSIEYLVLSCIAHGRHNVSEVRQRFRLHSFGNHVAQEHAIKLINQHRRVQLSERSDVDRLQMETDSEGAAALANKRAILVAVDDSEVSPLFQHKQLIILRLLPILRNSCSSTRHPPPFLGYQFPRLPGGQASERACNWAIENLYRSGALCFPQLNPDAGNQLPRDHALGPAEETVPLSRLQGLHPAAAVESHAASARNTHAFTIAVTL